MRILVTGGAGYIGSVVSTELLRHGYEVVVLDNLTSGTRAAVPTMATFVRGDVGDVECLRAIFQKQGICGVMHFAGSIEVSDSMRKPERHFENNSFNSMKLLRTMVECGVSKFIFSSTAAVYGNPLSTPINEDAPLEPTNAYGESKFIVERMLRWFHRVHGVSCASLRYFNAAGASSTHGEQHDPESHLIPIVLAAALGERKNVSVFGIDYPTPDGSCVRDYIHVLDLAAAHILAFEKLLESSEPRCLVYNLGNSSGYSVLEVIETAKRITGMDIRVIEAPRRGGDPAVLIASSEKIRDELRWTPRYADLESIIRSAWEWKLRNPRGCGIGQADGGI